ncbi:putative c3hc4 type (ring finger) zinc finger containing protein [Diplodia seriata]|uniref:Putative c3hc4 type (Ring finger) zinc finger containing protein n=1 Tax=Diplodia seriata TaxID=420778 RepID=A0A0G2DXY1_9PEZI|nr:putative c3hc4 type (ring finger) zinc finger containing protein [Diplodia seriata]
MSARPFAANNPSARRQQPALLQEHPSWSWPDATPDSRSLPGRQEAIEHLTLPPMHSHDDPDSDFDTPTATPAPFAPQPTRSNFLAQVLNGGDDGAATQRSAAVSSSRHRPAQSPPSHYNPRIPSPRNHGYVDLTREQTPPISQERSTLRTLHYSQQPTAESPSNTSSTSPDSAMLRSGRRKRDATSPLFVPLDPSSKRAKRNDGSSGTTGGRRGSRQEGANTDGPSNAAARSEVEEIERIDLIDDDTPLAEALQKQRAEQVKAQQESQNGADAPTTLTNITCVICMDVPKDLTATACGHVFCHSCLMEALIAGEQRAGPGEPKRSQCPVCRKALSRNKTGDIIPLLLMMKKGLATQPRRQRGGAAAAGSATSPASA